MSVRKTIGGDRLGAGKKMTVDLKSYERSSHDLGYVWRSTMAAGTLVPFMCEVGLPGDTFDIDLECDIKTHPTIGPLFGSYKVQLDVFMCPIRLYQGKLHNNKLGIGMEMANVKLPQLEIESESAHANRDNTLDVKKVPINPSSIFAYLGIMGIGTGVAAEGLNTREFNAVPYLAYWDIYKNYYANKQEEEGVVIHNDGEHNFGIIGLTVQISGEDYQANTEFDGDFMPWLIEPSTTAPYEIQRIEIHTEDDVMPKAEDYYLQSGDFPDDALTGRMTISDWFESIRIRKSQIGWRLIAEGGNLTMSNTTSIRVGTWQNKATFETEPKLVRFPLTNLDEMREDILSKVKEPEAFLVTKNSIAPYGLALSNEGVRGGWYAKEKTQEGLAIKTYQSDLFNNWMSTEWIDGENGISAITAIDTSDGNFTIDTLNISKKVYDMLNRIAISGGSYDDWLDAVYTHERVKQAESPIYQGGLIRELVFSEVISTAEADATSEGAQPLGTLAGKGAMGAKKKGGKVRVKVDEPSYIMGIISLTPRVDYSQGNKWDVNLKTMDDFHKPALDQIGFQDLITEQMASWDTHITGDEYQQYSAGKQPAWINYMTNVNQAKGNFALEDNEMFMTLNRRYEAEEDEVNQRLKIADLTTYIDPVKFNHIFAYTKRDAQNFWTQIGVDITARRKMSAKLMPNL